MKLKLFRHLWGVTGDWRQLFPKFKSAGYDGIECPLPAPTLRRPFRDLCRAHDLDFIPQIFTRGNSVGEHLASFRSQLAEAIPLKPLLVNAHSGRDAFSEAEANEFFREALKTEADFGVDVAHETHRGRILYNPWVASRLLDRFGALKLCCDFSHWVCVCERLITDQESIIRQCADRCLHLHARVGYEQGPQVPDPRAPEYRLHLVAHERWWRLVWKSQARRRRPVSTLTPEFGPPRYLHTLPFTNVPVADLVAICDWMAAREQAAFARFCRRL